VVRAGSRGFGGHVGVGWPARREGREAAVEDLVAGQERREEEAVGAEGMGSKMCGRGCVPCVCGGLVVDVATLRCEDAARRPALFDGRSCY
jgi:hypothetical protein